MANSLPYLSGLKLSVTVGEEAVNLAPQLIDANVTFVDADDNFNGGTLVLSGLATGDIVAIRNQGTGAGQIGASGTDVSYGGTVIGTYSGGSGGAALQVTFNGAADSASIEALIENLTYQSLSDDPDFSRNFELTVTDAAGAQAVTPVMLQEGTGAANPFDGIDIGDYSAPSFDDLDGDGDLDVVIGEVFGELKYYENTGTALAAAYVQRSGAANPFDGIDIGLSATLGSADLDGDGDLDAVIGGDSGTLIYYENTGSALAPAYVEQIGGDNPFDGIDVGTYSAPVSADLDGDGDLDAVLGAYDGTLRYYENTGTAVAPAYIARTGSANPFGAADVGIISAPSLADVDGDGDLDAVVGEADGYLNYFENTGTALAPAFAERSGAANPFGGIDVGTWSRPGFGDLDGDGDLDVVAGEQYGVLNYYENIRLGSAPGEVQMTARTGAANLFLGIDVGASSAPNFVDLDGDGDLDAVSGAFYGTVHYYENTGSALAPAYLERTGGANPFDGIDVSYSSKPGLADLDGDGDLDMAVGFQYGAVKYYENTGTNLAAAYVERTGAANPFDGINLDNRSAPSFADLDGDGDLDAVVGDYYGALNYYENTGTALAAAYVERTGAASPFDGVDAGVQSTPSFADLDGDGDLDAVVGEGYGGLKYFENTGTALAPAYLERSGAANPFKSIDLGYNTAPSFADLDGDGDLDAVIGEVDGVLNYFENTTQAGPGDANFASRTGAANPLNGIDVGYRSTPGFANLDGDGDLDVVVGEKFGTLKYYENTGTALAPVYVALTGAANPFNGIDVGDYNAPNFADLDGDGDLDAVLGEYYGALEYYENTGNALAAAYVERTGVANPFDGMDAGADSKPALADLNGDGDLDAMVGNIYGTFSYFENTGNRLAPAYVERTGADNPLDGVNLDIDSAPSFVDLDGDGDLDAVVGKIDGSLKYFENTGTALDPAFAEQTGAANPFGGIDVGYYSTPAFADLDGDGDLDVLMGEKYGSLSYYENTGAGGLRFVLHVIGHDDPSEGADVMNGTAGADSISGLGGNDTLFGLAGNDTLNGGSGSDSMAGGANNDSYTVTSGDVVTELGSGGSDTVKAGFDYTLGANLEKLTLTGSGAIDATGNGSNNTLTGNIGNNVLDGMGGSDTMEGGAGNDIYVRDATGDVLTENANEGTDTVKSSLTYTLLADFEKLTLTGSGAINGTGNGTNNTLTGNSGVNTLKGQGGADTLSASGGADKLYGGAGNDKLTGGSGNDKFVFDKALTSNKDTILDFDSGGDKLWLDNDIFTALGTQTTTTTLSAGAFFAGANAHDASDRIIYNAATGALYYDSDGNGAAAKVQFAVLSTLPTLTNTEFQIIA